MKIVSDVLHLSYLDKFGGSFSVGYYTFYRQHLRVDKESRPQQHTWNSEFFVLFPLKITAALSLHFQHLNED